MTQASSNANVVFSPFRQNELFERFGGKVDSAYSKVAEVTRNAASAVANAANRAGTAVDNKMTTVVNTMEVDGANTLNTPVRRMADFSIARITPQETDTDSRVAYLKLRNTMAAYHEGVVRKGEEFSRKAGYKAYCAVRIFPMGLVRLAAKVVGFEKFGQTVQEAVALAVGYTVRGALLAVSQLAHVAPYAVAAAVASAAGLGCYALAKASPLAAVALAGVVMLAAVQAQVANVSNKAYETRNTVRKQEKELEELNAKAEQLKEHVQTESAINASRLNGVAEALEADRPAPSIFSREYWRSA